ncbi:MAG TPA: hypothetical protein VGU61_19720 [Noviherbaspirillum sp.]|jgi:hypothetical protein|uniref:hypothetical protein n=1 Tax=Noviherbaspirillum sp. TaxID=1926288 RepID=UPI002DDD9E8E|nr:hypothetical protein [Noviherbaspirillum sp.]HEV2612500.1 hypothetical protein [Noviherbaspirillum sp.]
MNIYRYQFAAACPINDAQIIYQLTIETTHMIHVEHIVTFAALHKTGFHEDLADKFYNKFRGRQTMTAHHHGVNIETIRGKSDV